MDLQLAEKLHKEIEELEKKLDQIEDDGLANDENFIAEKSSEWMATWKKQIQVHARFFLTVNEGSEIQFNEEKTGFRVVTKENRGKKFW